MLTELFVLFVLLVITVGLVVVLWISSRVGKSDSLLRDAALNKSQTLDEGYVGVPTDLAAYVGRTGVAETVLRPAGKVRIGGELLDAVSVQSFIEPGVEVVVTKYENTQLYVKPLAAES